MIMEIHFREAASIQPVEAIESKVITIDASKKSKSLELTKIMGEMAIDDRGARGDDADLLDLMDS